MRNSLRAGLVSSAVAIGVTCLAACGGSSPAAKTSTSASASPTASQSGAAGAGAELRNLYSSPAVQACLKAAGIPVPSFSARASGSRPSNFPSGQRPTSFPSGQRPTGARGSGFAGGGDLTQIDAALKACGIAVPTFTPRSGGATPTASPSA